MILESFYLTTRVIVSNIPSRHHLVTQVKKRDRVSGLFLYIEPILTVYHEVD